MIDRAIESMKSWRLTGGIFGKTTMLLIVLCLCVAAIAIRIAIWWFALAVFLPMMGIVFYALKRCLDFAQANPQAAIMEGAELLIHERIVHGVKGKRHIEHEPAVIDHVPSEVDESIAEQADPPVIPRLDGPPNPSRGEGNG